MKTQSKFGENMQEYSIADMSDALCEWLRQEEQMRKSYYLQTGKVLVVENLFKIALKDYSVSP